MKELRWRDIVCIVIGRVFEREVLFAAKGLCRSISGAGASSSDAGSNEEEENVITDSMVSNSIRRSEEESE